MHLSSTKTDSIAAYTSLRRRALPELLKDVSQALTLAQADNRNTLRRRPPVPPSSSLAQVPIHFSQRAPLLSSDISRGPRSSRRHEIRSASAPWAHARAVRLPDTRGGTLLRRGGAGQCSLSARGEDSSTRRRDGTGSLRKIAFFRGNGRLCTRWGSATVASSGVSRALRRDVRGLRLRRR